MNPRHSQVSDSSKFVLSPDQPAPIHHRLCAPEKSALCGDSLRLDKLWDTQSDLRIPGRVLIKRRQLLQKVPLCERTILNLEKRGQFPQRFCITSRLVAWDLKEVDAWIAEQQTAARLPAVPQAQSVPRKAHR